MFKHDKILLDADYKKIFKPFYLTDYLFCMQSYNLKKNYATPVTFLNCVVSVIANIIIMALLYGTALQDASFFGNAVKTISIAIYVQYVQMFIFYSFLNIYLRKTYFQLLFKLQELCKTIKNTEDTMKLEIMNWMICIALMTYYISLIALKFIMHHNWHWIRGIFIMTTVVFEIKLTNVAVLMYYLALKVKKLQKNLQRHLKGVPNKEILDGFKCTFQDVLSTFDLIKKSFQAIVLIHFVVTFLQALMYIEVIILSAKSPLDNASVFKNHVISVVSWITKSVIVELLFCVLCEIFYTEIENTRRITETERTNVCDLEVIQSNKDVVRFSKSIQRILDNNFNKMTAFEVFTVDIALPMRLGGLVATYSLVLVQFAL